MSRVYVTTYEVVGAGLPIAHEFYAKTEAAREAQWELVEAIGGEGFRPGHGGGIRSVFFKDVPMGWRKLGRQGEQIEAVPNRGTKAEATLNEAARVPLPTELAAALGYSPSEMAIDAERGTIYFPTELRVSHPAGRIFVRLPRFDSDGFTPNDAMLTAVPESELMKAVEDHNAEAARIRQKEAA